MNWESRYIPPQRSLWTGRVDIPADSCFYQHVKLKDATVEFPIKHAPLSFALIGFQCDAGAQRDDARTGSAEGPNAVREVLARLPIQNPNIEIYDVGNITCTDADMEASQQALTEFIELVSKLGIIPIVIGGGHEVALSHYLAISRLLPKEKKLGILNFDAYFDLQPFTTKTSTKTTFWQIAQAHKKENREMDLNCIGIQHSGNMRQNFDFAKQQNVHIILADELHQGHQEKSIDFVDRMIDENTALMVSLSLDVFSPAFAPGVSTIQPLGLTPWQIIPLLRQVAASTKVIGYDISELVPKYDIDQRTVKLAATFIYEIIHHHHEPQFKH